MDHAQLTPTQSAALFVLLAESRELSNPELKELGPALDKPARDHLNALGLVDSRIGARRAWFHTLTDRGWAWCASELTSEPPKRSTAPSKAMYAVLAGLARYLDDEDLRLHEVFGRPRRPDHTESDTRARATPAPDPASRDPRAQIAAAYRARAAAAGDFVLVADLRTDVPGMSAEVFDATMVEFQRESGVSLIPQEDQALLTPEDRAAAVTVGTQACHLFAIEEI
ncbi:MarR family transcriptional regulator [Gordonia McavH-238-E]|uniref:MarR family transcriptional regulator n=1 Tax=Gordonia sp. McavH-238-E TaxID=2917736 RepID=UPI001EF55571|nr:MarR family transcriptional regulator [Gordonia sp. McavH-238-E]MCG7631346.1 MarR family transcriptional regulator [Gordonia sp. McavH-238-E]